ncbi:uncharacterized protein SPSK_01214 [Sporothrix schenckii 1099-18]|uniref:Phosphatidylethanolamine-binding protein PEBP n=1 Tax=Sporothrix schenckii 1099-18 TaxID=1397361 RepID=A0A0F2LZA4_SPOSC|nr:uncharacterized protein SPSK_01214 [Sporothrix schenckii 1099-18]KJR81221.1 hypothetical protein SPSK_01214 [Sporothrix schenckii 1099-18]
MVSSVALLAAAISVVSASTPPGFQPAVNADLVVDFGNTLINGQVVAKNLVANQPTKVGTTRRVTGNSFAVIMIDLDIPTNTPGQTSTLLHWMQTGLALSPQASRVVGSTNVGADASANNNGGGASGNAIQTAFLLRNATGQAPAAPYISPNPPARLPLSHTYAQFLVDTSGLSAQSTAMQTLMKAAQTRQGFNLQQVLQQAGLTNKLVAANFFNVTNPGPVQAASGNGTENGNGSGNGSGNSNGNGEQQQGSVSSTDNNSPSSVSSSSTTSTTNGDSNSGSAASSASGNNVVKANGAASLSAVAGPVTVLAGAVALFFAL